MAYTTPPTKVAGDLLAAAEWNTYIRDNLEAIIGRLGAIEFKAGRWTKTATQSIPDSTLTDVTFPTAEVFDEGGWGLTVSNTTITVPAGVIPAGFTNIGLDIGAFVVFDANATGRRSLELHKNGAQIAVQNLDGVTGNSTAVSAPPTVINAVAGDTFTVKAYQNSTGALDITLGAFWIARRGPY